mmetsp:Transcript_14180/g.57119  ORF Transcript_14180/g.57119 Transcript_14180/m.57119 type:complete len:80 (+) Transcript_14180:1959-2198(+)
MSLEKAQMRFAESLAGYSLVCYFGSISDRHNGNILITADGALVHVDFGYMFANSPGAIEYVHSIATRRKRIVSSRVDGS